MKTLLKCWTARFFFFFICFSTLYAEDEIVVRLGSDYALLPTYIEPFQAHQSEFSQEYLKQLQDVLSFDIGYNGTTRLVENNEKKHVEDVVGKSSFQDSVPIEELAKLNLAFLVRSKFLGKELEMKVVQITSGTFRTITPVSLSGELSKDRVKIHQIADFIHETFFGSPGIASTKILYVLRKGSGQNKSQKTACELIETDYDGFSPKTLHRSTSLITTPQWIPSHGSFSQSGKKSAGFLFVSYELGQPKLFFYSFTSGKKDRVTPMRGNQLTPSVSQDGSLVAFCSDITGVADLFVVPFEIGVGATGKPRQVFHARGSATACPTFSPDGKRVAFVSNKDGTPRIYVMDIPEDGTKVESLKPLLISKKCRESTAPSWSPDGKKIVFSGKTQGDRQIWVYDFERNTEQQLTDTKGMKESPSFAPDSLHIVFHAVASSGSELYLVNLHQPKPVKISSGSGDKMYVVWEPKL